MIFIIIILFFSLLLLLIGLDVKLSDLKKVKAVAYDKKLNQITNKLPNNIDICKQILNSNGINNVIIEESKGKDNKTSLYLVMKNKIVIANIDNTFTRVQTIAHECVHSNQNKRILKFNFIFSNIYILYFIIICILAITNIINDAQIFIILFVALLIQEFIYFVIRSFLEIDAMTKAPYIAKKYMDNVNILSADEIKTVMDNYTNINTIGIKLYIFTLASNCIIKSIIFCLLNLI